MSEKDNIDRTRKSSQVTSTELERLLNPTYCSVILSQFLEEYNSGDKRLPISMLYLCLPLVLHGKTRDLILSHRANFGIHRLIKENPDILVGLFERIKGYESIAKQSLLLSIRYGLISIDTDQMTCIMTESVSSELKGLHLGDEAMAPIKAAKMLGKWLSELSFIEVYLFLGILP